MCTVVENIREGFSCSILKLCYVREKSSNYKSKYSVTGQEVCRTAATTITTTNHQPHCTSVDIKIELK